MISRKGGPRSRYLAAGGPWGGTFLIIPDCGTMVFRVKVHEGRYVPRVGGYWADWEKIEHVQ